MDYLISDEFSKLVYDTLSKIASKLEIKYLYILFFMDDIKVKDYIQDIMKAEAYQGAIIQSDSIGLNTILKDIEIAKTRKLYLDLSHYFKKLA